MTLVLDYFNKINNIVIKHQIFCDILINNSNKIKIRTRNNIAIKFMRKCMANNKILKYLIKFQSNNNRQNNNSNYNKILIKFKSFDVFMNTNFPINYEFFYMISLIFYILFIY